MTDAELRKQVELLADRWLLANDEQKGFDNHRLLAFSDNLFRKYVWASEYHNWTCSQLRPQDTDLLINGHLPHRVAHTHESFDPSSKQPLMNPDLMRSGFERGITAFRFAEGVGFEPTEPGGSAVFKTARFVRSRIPPAPRLPGPAGTDSRP